MGMSAFFDEAIQSEMAKRDAHAKRDRRERIATAVLAGVLANPTVEINRIEAGPQPAEEEK